MEKNLFDIKIDKKKNKVTVEINPSVYNLRAVYAACYTFIDKAYIHLDGDPDFEIIVDLIPKQEWESFSLKKLAGEFKNEVLKHGFYEMQNKKTMSIKTLILQRILAIDDSIANIYIEKSLSKGLREQEKMLDQNNKNNKNNDEQQSK